MDHSTRTRACWLSWEQGQMLELNMESHLLSLQFDQAISSSVGALWNNKMSTSTNKQLWLLAVLLLGLVSTEQALWTAEAQRAVATYGQMVGNAQWHWLCNWQDEEFPVQKAAWGGARIALLVPQIMQDVPPFTSSWSFLFSVKGILTFH